MRGKKHSNELHRWLEAELAGNEDRAERALAGLFRSLPRPVPTAGFADRVLASASARRHSLPMHWWLAAALCSLGLLVPVLLASQLFLPDLVRVSALLAGGFQRFFSFLGDLGGAASALRLVAHLRGAVLVVASSPPVLLALLTSSLLAALAVRRLDGLLTVGRSSTHA